MTATVLWQESRGEVVRTELLGSILRVTGYEKASPPPPRQHLLYDHDYESGDLRGFQHSGNVPEVVAAPAHPVRSGRYSMRCYLHRYESADSCRTQVLLNSDPESALNTGKKFRFTIGEEYWIGLSIYLPADWVADIPNLTDTLVDCQPTPDTGELWRQAILSLVIDASNWAIHVRWDSRANTPDKTYEGRRKVYNAALGRSIGAWTDWVFHARWSWKPDGFLRVWRDGVRVVNYSGPIGSNDTRGPQWAMGLYKWPWKDWKGHDYPSNTESRLLYHDCLRIGDAQAQYSDVAP